MEKEGKQFPALRENIAQFVLFMFASLKNSILERLEVATKSGAQIEFIFEFSLPTCQLIEHGQHFWKRQPYHEKIDILEMFKFFVLLYPVLLLVVSGMGT